MGAALVSLEDSTKPAVSLGMEQKRLALVDVTNEVQGADTFPGHSSKTQAVQASSMSCQLYRARYGNLPSQVIASFHGAAGQYKQEH